MLRAVLFATVLAGLGAGVSRAAEDPWLGQGTVMPSKSAKLQFSSPRLITKFTRDVGTFVKKGDILVQCDEKLAKAALNLTQLGAKKAELVVKDAEAKSAAAKATLGQRKAEFEGAKANKLAVDLAEAELATALIQIDIAKIDLEFAKESLAAEEKKLEELALRAPFDGLISGRNEEVNVGDVVAGGTPILSMIGPPMIVASTVPDRLVKLVAVKYPVEVSLLKEFGGDTFQGQISWMSNIIDSKERSFGIQVSLPEAAQRKLFPGMIVNMKIVPKE
jgi:RND family efflux transporter MFP subunit